MLGEGLATAKKEYPEGVNPQESYALDFSLKCLVEWRILARSKTLKTLKRHEGIGVGNNVRLCERKKALKGVPKSGSSMK